MDTTIRNLDERLYKRLRTRAMAAGKTVGEAINDAMAAYLARPDLPKGGSILDIEPVAFPDGNEHLSDEIDSIVYGA